MSYPGPDPNERTSANDDLVCIQCEQYPAETDGLCERCRLFIDARAARGCKSHGKYSISDSRKV